jgi:Fic family protein
LPGRYIETVAGGERVRAYVPPPLSESQVDRLGTDVFDLLERANHALGRLDGVSHLFGDPSLFIYFYVRKEAVLSSQIEGTQSSLSDLLLFESDEEPGVPLDDVREVSNYVRAMNHGLSRLRTDGFPLSLRLLREIHGILLSGTRGSEKTPGEFRRSQNWIGGTRPGNATFVPPPPHILPDLLGNLEEFLHQPGIPVLLKAAFAHVQFETIHPFLDGNGRLGRLLVTFLLCAEDVLIEPLLYLSLYFKTHRDSYYDLLQRVRLEGAWAQWVRFFLEGIRETSQQAFETARRILQITEEDRRAIENEGRRRGSMLQIHEVFRKRPIMAGSELAASTKLSPPTVNAAVEALMQLGIVKETTGRKRDRVFAYDRYLAMLEGGAG